MIATFIVSVLTLIAACVAAGLAWSVLHLLREQHKWRQMKSQIFRDHAEFLKGLSPSPGDQQNAPTPAPATIDGKNGHE